MWRFQVKKGRLLSNNRYSETTENMLKKNIWERERARQGEGPSEGRGVMEKGMDRLDRYAIPERLEIPEAGWYPG